MKIRLSGKTLELLRKVAEATGLSHSDIARRSLRKARRIKPDLSAVDPGSTYGGLPVRLDIPEHLTAGMNTDDIRAALHWNLERHAHLEKPPVPEESKLIEGRDYVLAGAE